MSNSKKKLNEFSDSSLRRIAKEVVLRRFVLILHISTYILVNLLLFAINYFTYPEYYWFFWPLTGWLMVLIVHIFSHIMYKRGIVDLNTVVFLYHLVFYLVINGFLLFANWFISLSATGSSKITWALWVIGPWGILLIIHLIVFFYMVPKQGESPNKNWLDRKIDEELERIKKNYGEGNE